MNYFDFKFIKYFDIQDLRNEVLALDDKLWYEDDERQKIFEEHKRTQCIMNTNISLFWSDSEPYAIDDKKTLSSSIKEKINSIISYLEHYHNGKVGRSLIIRMDSHSEIPPHADGSFYLAKVHRCHIPIFTNPKVFFTVGDKTINMKEGECYEINNQAIHSVRNDSAYPRIHLLVDIIPIEYIK